MYVKRGDKCSVQGCINPVRAKGLCGKHYERVRAHGDVTADNRKGQKVQRVKCALNDCERIAICHGYCAVHIGRFYRHGSFVSRLPTYGSHLHIHEQGYRMILVNGKYRMEHIVLAEKALGKPLPKYAVVHHMNRNVTDNKMPLNLVICPDQSYHMLLHKRAKELGL